jgi:SAM-dependent MidA family methyltransferase
VLAKSAPLPSGNTPAENIRAEIVQHGAIPFARFMELALYCPLCGYYEKKPDTPGRRGDYYTSVSVGPLFGQLLAFRFAAWLERLRTPHPRLHIVEAGAHDGRLARDILTWLRTRRPELFARLDYRILEPSAQRRAWQGETLREFAAQVQWLPDPLAAGASETDAVQAGAAGPICGVIFSNELLDAFPVHRLGWDARQRRWFEWGVTWRDGRFAWTRLETPDAEAWIAGFFGPLPAALLDALPDGFTTEVCPDAVVWWRRAAGRLQCGKLLTLDYGLEAREFLRPERAHGTLRAYRRHQHAADPLADPGEQDLTAHVNFTALERAGESAGLKTEALLAQSQFLTDIAAEAWQPASGFGPWDAAATRQFQTLTHPEHLGRAFRVLIQSRE